MRRRRALILVAAIAALTAFACLPLYGPGYLVGLVTRVLIFALFAVAYNIVFGMGGMPAMGHAAFFGSAGYVVALGVTRWGWGFTTIVTAVVITSLVLGVLFGLVSARAHGIYLLLVTFALGQAVWATTFMARSITRGDSGIPGVTRTSIPLPVESRAGFYILVFVVVVVSLAVLWGFLQTPVGCAIIGIRESSSRMASLGYSVIRYKVWAFAISALFSGIAGCLAAYHAEFVGVTGVAWITSATVILMSILGGASVFLGPALGAAILIFLEFWLAMFTARWMSVLGVIYILTILVLPRGILGEFYDRFRSDRTAPLHSDGTHLEKKSLVS